MEIKGIIHCHSSYSYDAKLSLADLKSLFVSRGLRFVCMTEHTDKLTSERAEEFVRECEALSDETFLFIPGFEVPYKKAHILMIGQRLFFTNYARTEDELRVWTEEAPFVVLAHPVRNAFEVDAVLLAEMDGLEIWNQQYEGKKVPRVRSLKLFDTLRTQKEMLVAMGGLDFHREEHMGTPEIVLAVETCTEDAILAKLQTGAFTIQAPDVMIYGSLPNAQELMRMYRWQSMISVGIIVVGKWINKILAVCGISLPKGLKRWVRRGV